MHKSALLWCCMQNSNFARKQPAAVLSIAIITARRSKSKLAQVKNSCAATGVSALAVFIHWKHKYRSKYKLKTKAKYKLVQVKNSWAAAPTGVLVDIFMCWKYWIWAENKDFDILLFKDLCEWIWWGSLIWQQRIWKYASKFLWFVTE